MSERKRGGELGFLGELLDIGALSMPQRVIEHVLLDLRGRVSGIERLGRPFSQSRQRPRGPRRGPARQESLPYGPRLLLFALQLELPRFLRPFVLGRRLNRARRDLGDFLEPEKAQQRMPDVDRQPQALDRAGHRHVERVDVEFVQFERFVRLVFRPAVIEFVCLEIGRDHVVAQIGIDDAVAGDQIEKDDVRIFEAFRLMDGKDERRPKCARAAALSSSRKTITAVRTDARDDASRAFNAFSSALSKRTSPAA